MTAKACARSLRVVCVALAVGGMVFAGPVSAEVTCKTSKSTTALAVRTLQSDLMVAALSCNIKSQYNAFATKFQGTLVTNGKVLKAEFDKRFGGKSTQRLTTYVTELANQASQRMSTQGSNYCAQVAGLFQNVLALQPADLDGYARTHLAVMNGVEECAVESVAMATFK